MKIIVTARNHKYEGRELTAEITSLDAAWAKVPGRSGLIYIPRDGWEPMPSLSFMVDKNTEDGNEPIQK
jgi:hypothetical protein